MNKKVTESQHPNSLMLDTLSINQIIELINNEDSKISLLIKENIPKISKLIEKIVHNIKLGGRLIYVGAGTSGRLGVLDASECPPTFSTNKNLVIGIIAGGKKALYQSIEGAEDSYDDGFNILQSKKISNKDTVIGISASGSAPYVLGALEYSKSCMASTFLLTFNEIKKQKYIDKILSIIVGPEIISGSTRMKAGSATKFILNMITTVSMIKINKTYKNLMVDLKVTNKKLLDRGVRIISDITSLNYDDALKVLKESKYNVKIAVVMVILDISYEEAKNKVAVNNGNLANSIK